MAASCDEDLLYNPNGEVLKRIYPRIRPSKKLEDGFVKITKKLPNPRPYIKFKNLNHSETEDLPAKPAVEIGICGTF